MIEQEQLDELLNSISEPEENENQKKVDDIIESNSKDDD